MFRFKGWPFLIWTDKNNILKEVLGNVNNSATTSFPELVLFRKQFVDNCKQKLECESSHEKISISFPELVPFRKHIVDNCEQKLESETSHERT